MATSIMSLTALSKVVKAFDALPIVNRAIGYAVARVESEADKKADVVNDIRFLTKVALERVPSKGTRFHILTEGGYFGVTFEKSSGKVHPENITRVMITRDTFKLEGHGVNLHQVRVEEVLYNAELRHGYVVGARKDDFLEPSVPLERLTVKDLIRVRSMLRNFILHPEALHPGHPMATIE